MGLFGGFARDFSQGEASAKSDIYRSRRDTSSVHSLFPTHIPGLGGHGGSGIVHGLESIHRLHEIGRPVGLERFTRPEDIARPDRVRDLAGRGGMADFFRRGLDHMGKIGGGGLFGKGKGSVYTPPTVPRSLGSFTSDTVRAVKSTSTPDPIRQPYKPLSKQPYGIG